MKRHICQLTISRFQHEKHLASNPAYSVFRCLLTYCYCLVLFHVMLTFSPVKRVDDIEAYSRESWLP